VLPLNVNEVHEHAIQRGVDEGDIQRDRSKSPPKVRIRLRMPCTVPDGEQESRKLALASRSQPRGEGWHMSWMVGVNRVIRLALMSDEVWAGSTPRNGYAGRCLRKVSGSYGLTVLIRSKASSRSLCKVTVRWPSTRRAAFRKKRNGSMERAWEGDVLENCKAAPAPSTLSCKNRTVRRFNP